MNNNFGSINKIQQIRDGNYIAVGNVRLNNQNKIYLTKIDLLGNALWFKNLGLGENNGFWIEQTNDDGFIIGGSTNLDIGNSRAYLLKTDTAGNVIWERTYTYSDLDQCYCVKQTPDNGYIMSCRVAPFRSGIMLIKTDSLGVEQWRKIYYDNNFSISAWEIDMINDDYVTIGFINIAGQADIFIMKVDQYGDSIWTKRIGGLFADGGYSIDKIDNSSFIIGGVYRALSNNEFESYLCKLDTSGKVIWERTYSNLGSEECGSVRYLSNSRIIMAGSSDSLGNSHFNAKIRLVDSEGTELLENSFIGGEEGSIFNSIEQTSDGGFIAAGVTYLTGNFSRMFVAKTDSLLNIKTIGIENISNEIPSKFELKQNYPNPFNPETNIEFNISERTNGEIVIFDILGRQIDRLDYGKLNAGSYLVKWSGVNKPSGIYFYRLIAENFTDTKKMLLLK